MTRYVLLAAARVDMEEIEVYYAEKGGVAVAERMMGIFADTFRFLARTPGAGHRRSDLTDDPAMRFWTVRDYLVIYVAAARPIEIVAVMRGSRNVAAALKGRRA
jgi:plasmid stabilization system protein ParE